MRRALGAGGRAALAALLLVAGLLTAPLAGPARAQDLPATFRVSGVAGWDVLNVRAGPSAGAPVLATLRPDARGIEVLALSADGGWALVPLPEGPGWAARRFLQAEAAEDLASLPQRLVAHVLAVDPHHVEDHVRRRQPVREPGGGRGVAHVHPVLEHPEVGQSAVVERDHLAVDEQVAIPALRALRERGVRIAIDDFGTGYSSLHYLTRLPVDILKIDRSFVGELDGTAEGAAVAQAVVHLSKALHLSTVAEGIENEHELAFLRKHGTSSAQGYLFCPALPFDDFADLYRACRAEQVPLRAARITALAG